MHRHKSISLFWNLKVGLEHESILWTCHKSLLLFFFSWCALLKWFLIISFNGKVLNGGKLLGILLTTKFEGFFFLYNYLEYNSVVLAHAIIILQIVYVDAFDRDLSPSVLFKSCMHHLDGNNCMYCLLKLERDVNLICLEVVDLSKIEKA